MIRKIIADENGKSGRRERRGPPHYSTIDQASTFHSGSFISFTIRCPSLTIAFQTNPLPQKHRRFRLTLRTGHEKRILDEKKKKKKKKKKKHSFSLEGQGRETQETNGRSPSSNEIFPVSSLCSMAVNEEYRGKRRSPPPCHHH